MPGWDWSCPCRTAALLAAGAGGVWPWPGLSQAVSCLAVVVADGLGAAATVGGGGNM